MWAIFPPLGPFWKQRDGGQGSWWPCTGRCAWDPRFPILGRLAVNSERKRRLSQHGERAPSLQRRGAGPGSCSPGVNANGASLPPQMVLRKTLLPKGPPGAVEETSHNHGGQLRSEKSGKENWETP